MASALPPGLATMAVGACEAEAVNALVNLHMKSVLAYLSMSLYFSQANRFPASVGSFFQQLAKEKISLTQKLLEMLTRLGRVVTFYRPPEPLENEWGSAPQGLEAALSLEKQLAQSLLELHDELGKIHSDPPLCSFLQSLMEEEKKLIKEMEDRLAVLCRLGYPQNPLSDDIIERLVFKEIESPRDL